MKKQKLPSGWSEARMRRVAAHYDGQAETEAVAEDRAAHRSTRSTVMIVPTEVVPAVRDLIAKRARRRPGRKSGG
ncbi:MAG: hypothetical protein AAB434_00560 [Planctomycetota bacterium]